jgi:hypothetical protein
VYELELLKVYRYVNLFYFLIFLIYCAIFLLFIIPKRKEQPYKNAFRIFISVLIIGIAMEFVGTFSNMRVFYINNEQILIYQLLLQISIGLGEGGASMAVIYLMVEAIYKKDIKKYLLYMASLAVLMLIFASSTFLYKSI